MLGGGGEGNGNNTHAVLGSSLKCQQALAHVQCRDRERQAKPDRQALLYARTMPGPRTPGFDRTGRHYFMGGGGGKRRGSCRESEDMPG